LFETIWVLVNADDEATRGADVHNAKATLNRQVGCKSYEGGRRSEEVRCGMLDVRRAAQTRITPRQPSLGR
jgi:hypothetical protein